MNNSHKKKLSPAEFYRQRRPEYFSDSEFVWENELQQEVLALELNNITTNQKENEFECLCRRLAEKFIAPNLIPQVGPTGGGDGKTDSETYPVSITISERWFIPDNGWDKDEKWAFAISAKKTWKSKANEDIKKIIGTNRAYTRIYFMTNQLPSSKKKKDAQDEFKDYYNIEVIILDGKWILEKIYTNNLIDLTIDSLNMNQAFKRKKTFVGSNDSLRTKRLEELECSINNPNRYSDYDYQMAQDTLEAAILSRMIEKPRDEVEGKFERALRFCKKINYDKQWIRLYYQRAWTYLNWYDDYTLFIQDYKSFKTYVINTRNIADIELFYNLFNLLIGISSLVNLSEYCIDINNERSILLELISTFEDDPERPASSLIAKTYKIFILITESLCNDSEISTYISDLKLVLYKSRNLLEYPFEVFREIIEELGNIITTESEYDLLIDEIASIAEERNSELSAGEIFIRRAGQKLENNNYRDSILYFGKAVLKLSKDESKYGMLLSLRGLGIAYSSMGLMWASNSCFLAAASISLKEWFNLGKINKSAVNCIYQLTKNELLIGRISCFFVWHEMFSILSRQVNYKDFETDTSSSKLFDGCLTTRLLNTNYDEIYKNPKLPDLFEQLGFPISRDCLLYVLGYIDEILNEYEKAGFTDEKSLHDFFQKAVNQPFRYQIIYETNFLSDNYSQLSSKILGCEFTLIFESNFELLMAAETILSFLEGFLATSVTDIFPIYEKIELKLIEKEQINFIEFSSEPSINDYILFVKRFKISTMDSENLWKSMIDLIIHLVYNKFYINKPVDYIKSLFENENVNERLSLVLQHRMFTINILGDSPKLFLNCWLEKYDLNEYPRKRNNDIVFNFEKQESLGVLSKKEFDLNSIGHDKRQILSIIDVKLWDKAGWSGFGVIHDPKQGFGFFICFKVECMGLNIFDNWIKRVGQNDQNELIRISIIKGINKKNPQWYRVHISSNINHTIVENKIFYSISRIHELRPDNSNNLDYGIQAYNSLKIYKLFPAIMTGDKNGLKIFYDRGITKKELVIRNAWEIGENDLDKVVIKDDDDPYIPENIESAPIKEVLKKLIAK